MNKNKNESYKVKNSMNNSWRKNKDKLLSVGNKILKKKGGYLKIIKNYLNKQDGRKLEQMYY
jgi:hypothetical protein